MTDMAVMATPLVRVTGDFADDLFPEATFDGTPIALGSVANSVVRNVLRGWEQPAGCPSFAMDTSGGVSTRLIAELVTGSAATWRRRCTLTIPVEGWRTASPVLLWSTASGVVAVVTEATDSLGNDTAPTRPGDAVTAVRWLAEKLGVPDSDVVKGSHIKQRNWFNWQNGVAPRLDTQGDLWSFVQSVEALCGQVDDVSGWVRAGGAARRDLIQQGRHRELVREALAEASQRGDFEDPLSWELASRFAAGDSEGR
jgi:hypothetical protein